ncbi:amidohydrolase [Chloroflexales bacterium ZM16-3]|nr:amidohydrolase [Chloroflexales bacterium ZM16-3]
MSTLILYNGPIYTLDPQHPVARAVAIRDGRIVAVGSEGHVRAVTASSGRSEGINLQGRAVVPGLTDAHVHITFQGLASQEVRLGGASSIAEAVGRVADRARGLLPGAWLHGGGWNHAAWGGQWPSRNDLDAVCPATPVILSRKDGHSLWVNSAALAEAGITAATPDPSGGQIQRDRDGEPTGILLEAAMELVRVVEPPQSQEERQAAMRLAMREALSYGITSIHIPCGIGPNDGRETLSDLQDLRGRGELSLRCLSSISVGDLDAAIALGVKSGLGDAWLRVGGLKIFADGSLGSESAEMLSHYEGRRHLGIATIERELLEETVARANARGISVMLHAIGDAANRKVLDAIELARGDGEPPVLAMPNRIEHCQVLHPKDIGRLAELGVIASMQPIHCTSDMETADELWGTRCAHAYAWRELRDSGATLAFGSDAPVETMNPWPGVHAAVTRQRPGGSPEGGWHPAQRLTVAEALEAYCVGPAIASGEGHMKGRLAEGMLADMAVLTGDPFRSAPGELHAITAAMTLIEGKVIFGR